MVAIAKLPKRSEINKYVYLKNIIRKTSFPGLMGVMLIIGLTVGYFAGKQNAMPTTSYSREIRAGDHQFTNPLLECDVVQEYKPKEIQLWYEDVKKYAKDFAQDAEINDLSVYYRDLNNGPWFVVNPQFSFDPASLLKVPLMVAYYKKAETDSALLNQRVVVSKEAQPSEQNIVPDLLLKKGDNYSVDELIKRMIIYSDNDAYEILTGLIDENYVNKVKRDLGVYIQDTQLGGGAVVVKSYSSIFRVLYNSSYLSDYYSEYALNLLSQSSYKDAMVAGVPSNIVVSHKFGERKFEDANGNTMETQLHDCGIVYHPTHPYLLCIMTRGQNFDKLKRVINEISAKVYQGVDKSY